MSYKSCTRYIGLSLSNSPTKPRLKGGSHACPAMSSLPLLSLLPAATNPGLTACLSRTAGAQKWTVAIEFDGFWLELSENTCSGHLGGILPIPCLQEKPAFTDVKRCPTSILPRCRDDISLVETAKINVFRAIQSLQCLPISTSLSPAVGAEISEHPSHNPRWPPRGTA